MKKMSLSYLLVFISLMSCAQSGSGIELPAPLGNQEVILRRMGYTVSYNPETRIPNWVAWHLTAEHADGEVKRFRGGYLEDEDVPKPRATRNDYYGSEWSHGHMCPAGDNKWDNIENKVEAYANINDW